MKREKEEYGKDKVIQRIVNSSLAFVSLASSILLETVSRWKLYGIRLCLPLSRTAFHPHGEGEGDWIFKKNFMKFTKGYGERARFTDITIWIRNPRNSRGELLVISWWFHGNLADRNAINRWFSWKSRPVTLYALFFPVHETIIIIGDEKKISLIFKKRIFIFKK